MDHRARAGPHRQGLARDHHVQQARLLRRDAARPGRLARCPRVRRPHLPRRPGHAAGPGAGRLRRRRRTPRRDPAGDPAAEPGRLRRLRQGDARDAAAPGERLRAAARRRRAPGAGVAAPVDRVRTVRDHARAGGRPHVRSARPAQAARVGRVVDQAPFMWRNLYQEQMPHDFGVSNLRQSTLLHMRMDADYNGWWMCLIPVEAVRAVGLALPHSSNGTTRSSACAPGRPDSPPSRCRASPCGTSPG